MKRKVGKIKKEGWKDFLDLYILVCPDHGKVLSHVKGYSERLECPKCKPSTLKTNFQEIHLI